MVDYVVSFLEMETPPRKVRPPLEVLKALSFPSWYFLALYEAVGRDYYWDDMLQLSQDALEAYCQDPNKTLYTLIDEGVPAGLIVLNEQGTTTDLAYFGLAPNGIGKGLGGQWLDYAVHEAWQRDGLTRLTVNTCTLDHPRALPLYLSRGFVIVSEETRSASLD